ncbi:MAG: VOC family protein [Candidatus Palauibacterales bacterium]|nr:VOC family protein [Candidatus Palauibacterales bacterium]
MRALMLILGVMLGAGATFPARAPGPSSPADTVNLREFAFFAVRVEDVEAAAAWYRDVFDLDLANRLDAEDGRYAVRILSGGGLAVELIEQPDAGRAPDPHLGLFKAGIRVADIESFHQRLLALGVNADPKPIEDSTLNVRTFVFRDPEGNRIQAFGTID